MVTEKIKRIFRAVVIFWIFIGSVGYVLIGYRDLFEVLTLFIIGSYISFDIKNNWKYLLMFALTWNVADEMVVMFANDSFKLLALIPVIVFVFNRIRLFRNNLNYHIRT